MRFEIYETAAGFWQWRLMSRGRRVLADGPIDYATIGNAKRAAARVRGRNETPIMQIGAYTWQNRRLA